MSLKSQFHRSPRPAAWPVVFIVLTATCAWCAELPRIQGSCAVIDATQMGTEVHLTLELSLLNRGDAEIVAARLVLRDSLLLMKEYGSFSPLSIRAGQSVTLQGKFTIAKREYDLWQKGRQPSIFLDFGDKREPGLGQKLVLPLMRTGTHKTSLNS